MSHSTAAIALIRREWNGQAQWLARWSTDSKAFNFVGGQKTPEDTFRECVMLHVIEELGLEPEADFVVAEAPHSQLEYTGLSEGARGETACTMALYAVELIGDFSGEKIESDAANRWLLEAEIQAGTTTDGRPIGGTMNLLLELAGLWHTGPSDQSPTED